MKLFIECCTSKEKGTIYFVLKADVGYNVLNVTFEQDVMCQLADIKMSELYQMKAGDKRYIKINTVA